ncbi:hypothetical protein [Argonema antarcticum]|uniref:hypothetical protein n=1 Tax=Argonema antarcticum TaxID=2942763 RepID=UPI002011D3AE|nr:hypothetical protein [Argonema antarcticum]MCL1473693.1 hypothetical protein [Argonema antarcticum A004/B2]
MTEVALNTQTAEIARNYIEHLLKQLTVDYKNTKAERKKIASEFPASDEEFTFLEQIELVTVDIRGYASQIQARGWIENEQEAMEKLQNMQFLDFSAVSQLYFAPDGEYEQIKAYIRMLDYLRLVMIEYVRSQRVQA